MTDKAALENKLERLAASGMTAGGARSLTGTPDDILRLILREIDDIVLPRTLRLEGAGRRAVSCEVTSRRLVRLLGAVGGAAGSVEGQTLANDDSMHQPVRAYLEALIGQSPSVLATLHPLGRDVAAGEMGISARALADAWGLALDPRTDLSSGALVAGLVEGVGDTVLAWQSSGDTPDSGGSDTLVDELAQLPLGSDSPLLPSGAAVAISAMVQSDDETAICVARRGETTLAMMIRADAVPAALRIWRQLTG